MNLYFDYNISFWYCNTPPAGEAKFSQCVLKVVRAALLALPNIASVDEDKLMVRTLLFFLETWLRNFSFIAYDSNIQKSSTSY